MKNPSKRLSRVAYQSIYLDYSLINAIERRYSERHRYYHNIDHINYMINKMVKENIFSEELLLAILFHDIVYWPRKKDNELESADLFRAFMATDRVEAGKKKPSDEIVNAVTLAIMETTHHQPSTELSKHLCYLDLLILNEDFESVLEMERKIFKEYQWVDWKTYQRERILALEVLDCTPLIQETGNDNIEKLVSYLNSHTPNIAVYAGSFNPFHMGHLNILEKAESIFDKVIIAKGVNPQKENKDVDSEQFNSKLEWSEFLHRQTEKYPGLLTDFVKSLGYKVTLVRGLRNITDLQAELNMYRYLKDMMPELEMVSIYCDAEFEHISSSAIRDISKYGDIYTNKYRVS